MITMPTKQSCMYLSTSLVTLSEFLLEEKDTKKFEFKKDVSNARKAIAIIKQDLCTDKISDSEHLILKIKSDNLQELEDSLKQKHY